MSDIWKHKLGSRATDVVVCVCVCVCVCWVLVTAPPPPISTDRVKLRRESASSPGDSHHFRPRANARHHECDTSRANILVAGLCITRDAAAPANISADDTSPASILVDGLQLMKLVLLHKCGRPNASKHSC